MNQTQNSKIACWLTANIGEWVSMPVLWRHSGAFAVHSRIADLRKAGMIIENRKKRKGRKMCSYYKLIGTHGL